MREVYFAECDGRIKIGSASNVKLRLSQLKTGAGRPLTLIASVAGSYSMEAALHKKLKQFRLEGEWYRDCSEVRAAAQNCLNNFMAPVRNDAGRVSGNKRFGAVAKVLWPGKTAAHIAVIAGVEERTAKRWLSGEFEPPGIVIAAVIVEITKRE